MTPEQAAELYPIVKAYSEGKPIEYFYLNEWRPMDELGHFQFLSSSRYRVKPERETLWINKSRETGIMYSYGSEGEARKGAMVSSVYCGYEYIAKKFVEAV